MRLSLALASLLWTGIAAAQDAPRAVVLHVPDCMGISGSAVRELVALELTPRLQVIEASTEPALTGTVACAEAPAPVLLTVEDPAHATPFRVELDLAAAAPLARPRLLALTLAELITTSQLEHPQAKPATSTTEPAAPASETEAAQAESRDDDDDADSARRSHALQLWVAPAFAIAAAPATPLFGADLGAAYALGPVLLAIDLQAQLGQNARTSSDVALRSLSAGLAVLPIVLEDGVQLSAGAGLRAGHVELAASAAREDLTAEDFSGFWLGPMALAALHLPFSDAVALRFAIEAGYVARNVVGRDQLGAERLALRGPWLTLALGFALGLD